MADEPQTGPPMHAASDRRPTDPAERIAVALEGINYDMVAIRRRLAPAQHDTSSKNAWIVMICGFLIGLIVVSMLDDRDKMPKGLAP